VFHDRANRLQNMVSRICRGSIYR